MLIFIENTPRAYAWGSTDALPDMLGTAPTGEPQAELWLGAHPKAPSRATRDARTDSLLSLDAWPLGGCFTTAKDPTGNGDWTNYNSGTFRHPIGLGLIVGGFDTGAASGGGSRSRVQRRM